MASDRAESGVATATRARTAVVSRTGFLGRFVREIVLDLMGKAALLYGLDDIVDRGIVEEQSVGAVTVEYTRDERLIGRVTIEIDYERHRVNCRRLGETVTVDLERSHASQVSEAVAKLVTFFQKFREVTRAGGRLLWSTCPGKDNDEALRRVGGEAATPLDWVDTAQESLGSDELEYALEVRAEKLDEVTIRARHVDPRCVKKEADGE
ncbi:MAG: hypothetical protein HY814_06595 [Candidatus Riflebacteria bacterium]|nr:hypothetical protein [Candidatus Riflebacteria bacterium]